MSDRRCCDNESARASRNGRARVARHELEALASRYPHDLYLLTSPDERAAFFERLRGELDRGGREYVVLEGDFASRTARAIDAVKSSSRDDRNRRACPLS